VEKREGGLDMGRRKYTDEQVINILREGEAGAKVPELCPDYIGMLPITAGKPSTLGLR
jgi:hypothetical protein